MKTTWQRKIPPEEKPIGTLALNNFGGLCIMKIIRDIDDYVVSAENYGNGYIRASKARIRYDRKGNPYFMRFRQKYYLNEFMKVG